MTAEQRRRYTAIGLTDQTVVRAPGQIDGQQFIVDNCKDCVVHVLDHCAQVTIDDCVGCTIVIGPCADSVFARDCRDCTFHAVCQQWRTRDCADCRLYVWVPNEPVIEGCSGMEIGAWNVAYPRLRAHFQSADLDPARENRWQDVYNFTPPSPGGEAHWRPASPLERLCLEPEDNTFGAPETPLDDAAASAPKPAPAKKAAAQAAKPAAAAAAPRPERPPRSASSKAALAVACAAVLGGGNAALDTLASALFPSLFASPDELPADGEGAEGAMPVPLPLAITGMIFAATLASVMGVAVPPLCPLGWRARMPPAAAAIALYVWTAHQTNAQMSAAGTHPTHSLPTTHLLTEGPFGWSRHPLYCVTTAALAGAALATNSATLCALLLPWSVPSLSQDWLLTPSDCLNPSLIHLCEHVVRLVYLGCVVVPAEELYLQAKFGPAHEAYAASVPLWLPWPATALVVAALAAFNAHLLWGLCKGQPAAAKGQARAGGAAPAGGGGGAAKSDVCVTM